MVRKHTCNSGYRSTVYIYNVFILKKVTDIKENDYPVSLAGKREWEGRFFKSC
jgi:hypothetical protein